MTNPVIDQYGNKRWFKKDLLHRTDGPAIEYANGDKIWRQNNQLHRIGGPAIERVNGNKEYWVYGKKWRYLPSKEDIIIKDIIE